MTLTIPAQDHGQIRVFAVSRPGPDGLKDKSPEALEAVLGTRALDTDFIDVLTVEDLAGMALSDYIRQGYDIEPDETDAAALRNIGDAVILLVMSRASTGQDVTLSLGDGVQHVTTLSSAPAVRVATPLKSEAASGVLTDAPQKAPPSDAAMSGRVATIALVVILALVGLMVWIAA